MIPRRIRLRNFLSYRDCTLDLRGLHLAVLCGRNGDGKSALLDAMTWALWGDARGRVEDDRIHLGEQEMLVDFEFDVDGDVFQVIRKRTRGKGSGALDFFLVEEGGRKTSLTGSTARETQAQLNRRLHMDSETFKTSAFIAQGRADEFTRRSPADRKEVFRKVLGLERYEQYADIATGRKKDAASEVTRLERNMADAREDIERLPQLLEGLVALRVQEQELSPAITLAEAQLVELRMATLARQEREHALTNAIRARDEAAEALVRAETDVLDAEQQATAARAMVEQAPDIEARYTALKEAREAEQRHAALQAEARRREIAIADAEGEIGRERVRLESQAGQARQRMDDATKLIAILPGLRARDREVQVERKSLGEIDARVEAARRCEQELRERAASLKADAGQYRQQAQELKDRDAQLDGVAKCPVCLAPLGPDDIAHVREEYAAQRRALGERYRAAMGEAAAAADRAEAASATAIAAQAEHRARDARLRAGAEDLARQLPAAEQAERDYPQLQAQSAQLDTLLAAGAFAAAAQEARSRLAAELAGLGYNREAHEALRLEAHELAPSEAAYMELQQARARLQGVDARLDRERALLEERRVAVAGREAQFASAGEALALCEDVSERLQAAENGIAALRGQLNDITRQIGRLESDRERLQALAARMESAIDECRGFREEEQTYGDLAQAFGKNGVQAMLIDQALPELESIANRMLEHMTAGRIQVALATQRITAAGAVRETLDIRISDDLGTRDYEMYSGGEAFRVDFALRIALARLLAQRAGAALPTLIIDEGFGTQDQEGIDRLVEAINAVSEEFRLILVVTHIEELRERFERRIEVTKTLREGSLARVM